MLFLASSSDKMSSSLTKVSAALALVPKTARLISSQMLPTKCFSLTPCLSGPSFAVLKVVDSALKAMILTAVACSMLLVCVAAPSRLAPGSVALLSSPIALLNDRVLTLAISSLRGRYLTIKPTEAFSVNRAVRGCQ